MKGVGTNPIIQYTRDGLDYGSAADRIRLEVFCRQWEIAELVRDMSLAETVVKGMERLAASGSIYALRSLYYRILFLNMASRFSEAQAVLDKAVDAAEAIGDLDTMARLVYTRGIIHFNLSDFQAAIDCYRQALQHDQHGNAQSRVRAISDIGLAHWRMGHHTQALEMFTEAERLSKEMGDSKSTAMVKANMASVLLATGKLDRALVEYREALAISRRTGDSQSQSILYNNIGAVLLRQGHYQEAAELFQQGIELDRMTGAVGNLSGKLNNLAILKAMFGDKAQARTLFEEALSIDQRIGNLNGQMIKLGNIADLSVMLGDNQTALERITEAVEISRRIDAKAYLAHNLAVQADIAMGLGRYDQALTSASEAVEISAASDNTDNRVHSLMILAYAQSGSGLHSEALATSSRLMDLMEAHQTFEIGSERAFLCRAEVLQAAGQGGEAGPVLERCLEILRDKAGRIEDPEARRQFLENNSVHQRLKQLGAIGGQYADL